MIGMLMAAAVAATADPQRELQLALLEGAFDFGACEQYMPKAYIDAALPGILGQDLKASEKDFAGRGHMAAVYVQGRLNRKVANALDHDRCVTMLDHDVARIAEATKRAERR